MGGGDVIVEERRGLTRRRERLGWGRGEEGPSHPLLELGLLLQRHGVSLGYDGDDVHHFAEVFHELQVKRSQAGAREGRVSGHLALPHAATGQED